jgi:hypothetical protein
MFDDSTGARALRTGRVALLVFLDHEGRVRYMYDPSRGESFTARLLIDRAIQNGAGRTDPVIVTEQKVTEKGSRYIDFVIPGLLGMNLMGSGIWGIGFAIVDSRSKRLLKRFMATPMSRSEYLLSFLLSRLAFLILEVVTLLGFGALALGVPLRGSFVLQRTRPSHRVARENGRRRFRSDESRDDADVDFLGSVFFLEQLPRDRSAGHQAASAHLGKRCASRKHAGGNANHRPRNRDGGDCRVARYRFCRSLEAFQMAIGV